MNKEDTILMCLISVSGDSFIKGIFNFSMGISL